MIVSHSTHNIRSGGTGMMGACVILVREEEQLPVHRILQDRRKALPVQKTEWVNGLYLTTSSGKALDGASEQGNLSACLPGYQNMCCVKNLGLPAMKTQTGYFFANRHLSE